MKPDSGKERADQLAAMLKKGNSVNLKRQKKPSPERHKARLKHPRNIIGLIGLIIGFGVAVRDIIIDGGFQGITYNGVFSGAPLNAGFNSTILLELYSLVFLGLIYGVVIGVVLYAITHLVMYLRRKG